MDENTGGRRAHDKSSRDFGSITSRSEPYELPDGLHGLAHCFGSYMRVLFFLHVQGSRYLDGNVI